MNVLVRLKIFKQLQQRDHILLTKTEQLQLKNYEERKSVGMINVRRRILAHLKDVTGTGSSRGFRQWSQLSVLIWSRSAVNNFPKSLSKAVTEESVKNRIDAAVGVRQNMTRYLHHYRRRCQWIHVQRFCHQDHLFQRTHEKKRKKKKEKILL